MIIRGALRDKLLSTDKLETNKNAARLTYYSLGSPLQEFLHGVQSESFRHLSVSPAG